MMKQCFVPIIAGLMIAGAATAQESTTKAPTTTTTIFQNMQTFSMGGGFLGVVPGDVTPENMKSLGLAEEYGVVLNDVLDNTPARTAGLQKNDVVIGWNGTRVESAAQLRRLIHETPAGRSVKIDYIRGGSRQSADVKIGQQQGCAQMPMIQEFLNKIPNSESMMKDQNFLNALPKNGPGNMTIVSIFGGGRTGAELQPINPQLAKYFGLDGQEGALVGSVKEKSPAADAGLQAGDVITAIDGQKVNAPLDVFKTLAGKEEGNVTVTIVRDKQERTVTMKLPKQETIDLKGPFENFGKEFKMFNLPEGGMRFEYRFDDQDGTMPTPPLPPTAPNVKEDAKDSKLSQLRGAPIGQAVGIGGLKGSSSLPMIQEVLNKFIPGSQTPGC